MNFSFPTFTPRVKEFDSFWNQLGEFLPLSAAAEQPIMQPETAPENTRRTLTAFFAQAVAIRPRLNQPSRSYAHTGGHLSGIPIPAKWKIPSSSRGFSAERTRDRCFDAVGKSTGNPLIALGRRNRSVLRQITNRASAAGRGSEIYAADHKN